MNDTKLKKFSVSVFVQDPFGKEYLNHLFIDAETNFHAFAIAWGILKISQFSKVAWQATEIPQETREIKK